MRIRKARLDPQDPRLLLLAAVVATMTGLGLHLPVLAALGAGVAGYWLGQAERLLTVDPRARARRRLTRPEPESEWPATLDDADLLAPETFEQQLAASGWPRSPDG